jgi:uncharacterized protein
MREWVIKVSRLCNLRCGYCYEWDGLGDPRRMSLSLWPKILDAIKRTNECAERTDRYPSSDIIVWHGGEPTLLPLDYIERVMALQHATFPAEWFRNRRIENRIQSNFYALPEAKIDLLVRHDFAFGISFDVVAGARRDRHGNGTEERVLRNIESMRRRGIEPAMIVVIAGHTVPMIDEVYRFLRQRRRPCRVLPLFDGPDTRPMAGIAADRETINSALMRIFRLWFEDGCPFPMRPFDEYLRIVVSKMLGLERRLVYDRRIIGDKVLVVDLDGRLYEPWLDAAAEYAIGDLSVQTIDEIRTSPAYTRSLERNDRVRDEVCARCDYFGACGSKEMFMVADGGAQAGRCMTAQPLCRAIESYLAKIEVDDNVLRSLFADQLREQGWVGTEFAA